jgi:hypothetical protein
MPKILFLVIAVISIFYIVAGMAFGENPQGFTEDRIPFYRKKEKRGNRKKGGL